MNVGSASFQFIEVTFSPIQPAPQPGQNSSSIQESVVKVTSKPKLTTRAHRVRRSCNNCRDNHIKCNGLASNNPGRAKEICSNCSKHGYECNFILVRRPGPKKGSQHKKSASENDLTSPRKSQRRNQSEVSETAELTPTPDLPEASANTDIGAAASATQPNVSLLSQSVLGSEYDKYSFEGYDALLEESMPWLSKIFEIEANSSVFNP